MSAAKNKTVEKKEEELAQVGEVKIEKTSTAKAANQTKKEENKVKEEVKAPEKAKEKAKDPVLDFEIDPSKSYEFRLKGSSYRKIIPNSAIVFDEGRKAVKKIQLTDTEKSPFMDDHDEDVKPSRKTLSFKQGKLVLKGTNESAIRYLLAYDGFADKVTIAPGNRSLKGAYTLYQPEVEQARKLEQEKLKIEAQSKVVEAEAEDLEDFVSAVLGKSLTGDLARIEAIKIAKGNPKAVVDGLGNPVVKTKAQLVKAVSKGLIAVVNGKIVSATGKVLFTGSGDLLQSAAREISNGSAKGSVFGDVLEEVK